MEIIFFIIFLVILYTYLKIYNSHPYFFLDKNGVIKRERQNLFFQDFLDIKKSDFDELKRIHLSYFPDGSCEIHQPVTYYGNTPKYKGNTIYIYTSIKCDYYPSGAPTNLTFPISFIIQKIEQEPDIYVMFLTETSSIGNITLKGEFFKGTFEDLKFHFHRWERKQLNFLQKNK